MLKKAPLAELENKITEAVDAAEGMKNMMVERTGKSGVKHKTIAPMYGRTRTFRRRVTTPPHVQLTMEVPKIDPDNAVRRCRLTPPSG